MIAQPGQQELIPIWYLPYATHTSLGHKLERQGKNQEKSLSPEKKGRQRMNPLSRSAPNKAGTTRHKIV
ncbi:hypothetical protein, partial [Bifidobacterium pseudolongum]|uniref:hypothetical protein n=1 Tax=Bifidobacterium pseudolongum TaxID=1694 RepID=UPI001C564C94